MTMVARRRIGGTLSTVVALAVVLSCTLKMRTTSSGPKFVPSAAPGLAMAMVDSDGESPMIMGMPQEYVMKATATLGAAIVGTYIAEQPLPWSGEKVQVPDKVALRRFLHIPIKYMQRLNEKWMGPVNWDRVGLRLGAMDTYALCAGILLQTVMGLPIHGNKPDDDADLSEKVVYDLQVFFMALAAFCSTWTMIIFLFNKIYCVKAISIYHDVNYAVFLSATRNYRLRAFQSLIVAFMSYLAAYTAVYAATMKGKKGIAVVAVTVVFCILMMMEASSLVSEAEALAGETPLVEIAGDNFIK